MAAVDISDRGSHDTHVCFCLLIVHTTRQAHKNVTLLGVVKYATPISVLFLLILDSGDSGFWCYVDIDRGVARNMDQYPNVTQKLVLPSSQHRTKYNVLLYFLCVYIYSSLL